MTDRPDARDPAVPGFVFVSFVASITINGKRYGKTEAGGVLFESIENLSLDRLYSELVGRANLNTCGNPDCGNFGFAFNPDIADPRGGSSKFKLAAASSAAMSTGAGQYKLSFSGEKEDARVSSILEYENEPRAWMDTRTMVC
jgi:hypothetical protein